MASIENKIREMMNTKAQLDEAFPGMGHKVHQNKHQLNQKMTKKHKARHKPPR